MTISELLSEGKSLLKEKSLSANIDAEILLSLATGLSSTKLITSSEEELSETHIQQYRELIQKRHAGIPIAYLTKSKEFYGRTYYVDERVLIPRPETEELIESSIEYLQKHQEITQIIDIGTGSGVIAISMGFEMPKLKILGIDISEEALEVAQRNAKTHKRNDITWIKNDLLKDLRITENSFIIANLPYIGKETHNEVSHNTEAYEPHTALFSGSDGLDHYRRLFVQINEEHKHIKGLSIEYADSQKTDITSLIEEYFPKKNVHYYKDLHGLERYAIISL